MILLVITALRALLTEDSIPCSLSVECWIDPQGEPALMFLLYYETQERCAAVMLARLHVQRFLREQLQASGDSRYPYIAVGRSPKFRPAPIYETVELVLKLPQVREVTLPDLVLGAHEPA